MKLVQTGLVSVALVALALIQGTGASAASPYTLFGDASKVHPGNASNTAVQLRSASTGAGYGGIDFASPAVMTVAQLDDLSTDYNFTAASCGGGAPRFQINVDGVNIFVYIGPPPSYTGCPAGVWLNTGNLLLPASFVDTSQLPGGTFYDTWAAAQLRYGSSLVTGIQLVTDAGWKFGTQTVLIDNVTINATTHTFEDAVLSSKDQCKDGGWRAFTSAPGPFKNQGDCVSYVATGGKNAAGD